MRSRRLAVSGTCGSLRANLPRLRAGRRARLEKRVKRKLRAALLVGRPSLTFTTEHHEERRPPRFVCDQIVGSRVAFAELAVARWWDKLVACAIQSAKIPAVALRSRRRP